MAKVYQKFNPDDDLTLEEIEDAINSAGVHVKNENVFLTFMYAGMIREGVIKNKRVRYIFPYGRKAERMSKVVMEHVLKYPNSYLPRHLLLRVLLGND